MKNILGFPPQLFIGRSGEKPEPQKMEPIQNQLYWNKPNGGLWTSTYQRETDDSDWLEWCKVEQPDWIPETRWLLYPKDGLRILRIDSLSDLKKALVDFRATRGPAFLSTRFFAILDFEKLSQEFDGMHLTRKGQAETRMTEPSLYGWDCESTLWFRWCFDRVEAIGKALASKRMIFLED